MTIKRPALIVMIVFFLFIFFILVDYQTELWEIYLVTGDWSQSTPHSNTIHTERKLKHSGPPLKKITEMLASQNENSKQSK